MRPGIGRYGWDNTIFKGDDELEIPEEIIISHVGVQEEMMQRVTDGMDQIYIEDDVQGNEEFEYVDLISVPDAENTWKNDIEIDLENVSDTVSENPTKKRKIQSKITSFFTDQKK